MRAVIIAVGAVVLVGGGAAAWLLSPQATPQATPPDDSSGSSLAQSTPSPAASPTPAHAPTPVDGSEVIPPDPSSAPIIGIPPRAQDTPLMTTPLPAPGAATGALVVGFPADILGPPVGTDIIDSAIAGDGTAIQVTLTARTDAPADEVRRHYRDMWSALGLTEQPVTGPTQADSAYADAYSSLSLAFPPASGTGTLFMVYGVLRAN